MSIDKKRAKYTMEHVEFYRMRKIYMNLPMGLHHGKIWDIVELQKTKSKNTSKSF